MADENKNSSALDQYLKNQQQQDQARQAAPDAPVVPTGNVSTFPGRPDLNISATPTTSIEPGGFWRRFCAASLDSMITSVVLMPISIPLGIVGAMKPDIMIATTAVSYLFSFIGVGAYFGWFYSRKGASPGKMVMGLKVMSEGGKNLSFWQAVGRETVGKMISAFTLMIGFIMAGLRADKKALHDLIFATQVLRVKK